MRKSEANPYFATFAGLILSVLAFPTYPLGGIILLGVSGYSLWKCVKKWSRFNVLWKHCNLTVDEMYPEVQEHHKYDWGEIYRLSIPPGKSLDDFEKCRNQIQQFLDKDVFFTYRSKNIIMEVYDNKIQFFDYTLVPMTDETKIPIGKKRNGEWVYVEMSKSHPHILIAGESGGGKSTCLDGILTTIIASPQLNARLHLIDLKGGCELGMFRESSKVANFGRTAPEALFIIKSVANEVERRYDLFYQQSTNNIKGYANKTHQFLPTEYLVIDEFAELVGEKECLDLIKSLSARARSAHIFLILCTQRPEAKSVLDGLIKANITNVIGFKTVNHINSQMIIDEPGLELLHGEGHGIYKCGLKKVEFQAPYIDDDMVEEFIKSTIIKKPVTKNLLPTTATQNPETIDFGGDL